MSQISAAATSAREAARSTDGRFGPSTSSESTGVRLPSPAAGGGSPARRPSEGERVDSQAQSVRERVREGFPDAALLHVDSDGEGMHPSSIEDRHGNVIAEQRQIELADPDLEHELQSVWGTPDESAVDRNLPWDASRGVHVLDLAVGRTPRQV